MALRRRFRLPVISRLTWAWLSAGGVMLILGAVFIQAMTSRHGPGRIALPIDEIEYQARIANAADAHAERSPEMEGLRLAPRCREGAFGRACGFL